ncbi:exo-beta-N-acetylmuramidase NamZ family protein [Neptunitalea lumnitzerae]|uniref:DUF1343 domain-containing protein n=1 Tax=Neptunitalea lumnitzerae TaxID=2965509 RepID=A0ABQ5MHK5_9FLAO|nr:DUF1343 domain-containing protein [Neptunitalea sp. Y10]GLB48889.1 hypothetical protein Y10_12570 [Neptunitalea sp. Y10]
MISQLSFKNTFLLLVILLFSCGNNNAANEKAPTHNKPIATPPIITGAENTEAYLAQLSNKKVGIVTNQTGILQTTKEQNIGGATLTTTETIHLVDFLIQKNINITKIFAPEHGFRGTADAGEHLKDGKDVKTGLPIISLYGNNKKPKSEQLKGLDVLVFDLQDVGARFYTYISTLHYVMEACAENNIPLIVLDRPNPNAHIIDGPLLEKENKSFVGMHPVPVLYGMTIGEYGKMINGEKWLNNDIQCQLTVIPCKNYTHQSFYSLPVKPSPNLPNDNAIALYPSLCFFEGTNVSVGRGTNLQFQLYGAPFFPETDFSFTPAPNEGAKNPKYNGTLCHGYNLSATKRLNKLELKWLLNAYKIADNKSDFFISFFTKLAGTKKLQQQIAQGLSETSIRESWQKDLDTFKTIRKQYVIYED